MLAQADHNNMGSLSERHEKTKKGGLDGAFPAISEVHFSNIFQGASPRTPLVYFGASSTRNTGHLYMRNLQQAAHSLETLRLDSSEINSQMLVVV